MKDLKQSKVISKRLTIYLATMLAMVIVLAVWLHEPAQEKEVVVTQVVEEPELPPRDILLYFSLAQEPVLYPETRQIEGCDSDLACLDGMLKALAAGPGEAGGLIRVLPEGTLVNQVQVEEDLVTIDFSARLVNGHPGGSLTELMTVYAVVDSVAANFPHLRRVSFLVDGEPRATLKGHVDLSQPVAADFSWTRNPEEEELTISVKGGEDG